MTSDTIGHHFVERDNVTSLPEEVWMDKANHISKEACSAEKGMPRMGSALDVVELTDSEDENIIDLTQYDSEKDERETRKPSLTIVSENIEFVKCAKRTQTIPHVIMEPLYLDDHEDIPEDYTRVDDDDTILILDEPKSARKPLRKLGTDIQVNGTPTKLTKSHSIISNSIQTPKPRLSKAQAALERERRIQYAQQLFDELNEAVFKNGLPKATPLTWNKRLLTTAGRAKWHKNKEGTHVTEIELSEKILDTSEKIRNTLSHEMCHLATWVIDADPKQGHGKLWKRWTARVMKKCPEIEISTRHNYEISYPYQWVCEKCAKVYGRFSKSIRPDECVCGACKEGRLAPLFSTQERIRKVDRSNGTAAVSKATQLSDGLDSESEVEILLTSLRSIAIQ